MIFSRTWAMPNKCTFSIPPIKEFIEKYIIKPINNDHPFLIVDPFARDSKIANITNDLNPESSAQYHMEAVDFLDMLIENNVKANAVIFDPPYSPRQISEVYASIGKKATMQDTQNARLYKEVKDRLKLILKIGGKALSFGWNSSGFGNTFETNEIMLVAHGGAHNDTICMAQTKLKDLALKD